MKVVTITTLYNHLKVEEVRAALRLKRLRLKTLTGMKNIDGDKGLEMLTCPRTAFLNLVAQVQPNKNIFTELESKL